jgi:hypothetical protein
MATGVFGRQRRTIKKSSARLSSILTVRLSTVTRAIRSVEVGINSRSTARSFTSALRAVVPGAAIMPGPRTSRRQSPEQTTHPQATTSQSRSKPANKPPARRDAGRDCRRCRVRFNPFRRPRSGEASGMPAPTSPAGRPAAAPGTVVSGARHGQNGHHMQTELPRPLLKGPR